jgi:hypothetical protein
MQEHRKGTAKKSKGRPEELKKEKRRQEKKMRRKMHKNAKKHPDFLCIDKVHDP